MFKFLNKFLMTAFLMCGSSVCVYAVDATASSEATSVESPTADFVKYFLAAYRKNPTNVIGIFDEASSNFSEYVVDNTTSMQFLEVVNFKMRHKALFVKLGKILLSVALELTDSLKLELSCSDAEKKQLDKALADLGATEVGCSYNKKKKPDKEFKVMAKKAFIVLEFIFKDKLGLSDEFVNKMRDKLVGALASEFSDKEIEILCAFINKDGGAFDFMVENIDVFWDDIVGKLG